MEDEFCGMLEGELIDVVQGEGGTSYYPDLAGLPSINGVTLVGNKTSEELGLVQDETDPTVPAHVKAITEQDIEGWNDKADKGDIPDVGGFITKDVEDLKNYYDKGEVDEKLSPLARKEEIPDVSDFATKGEVPDVSGLATKDEIPDVSAFITNAVDNLVNYYLKSEVYTKEEVKALIEAINGLHFERVDVLPSENIDESAIYLVAVRDGSANNYYEEYVYINGAFEIIGTTKIDLSGYVTTEALNTALSEYAKKGDVPSKTSELENDSGFITEADIPDVDLSNYYTKSETEAYVDEVVGNINTALENILGV